MLLNELLDLYIEEKILAKATVLKYKEVVRIFSRDTQCNDIFITHNEVIKWRNKLMIRVSATTCQTYFTHIKSLFNFAVKADLIDKNVFIDIIIAKPKSIKLKINNDKTISMLISLIKHDDYYSCKDWFYLAMIDVLRYTAIRRRQLIGITWRDVDFKNKTLYLNANFSKNSNENLIPINDILIKHFKEVKNNMINTTDEEQVFNITKIVKRYKSKTMKEAHVSSVFSTWSKKIGVPISAHRFRHTIATKLANSGCNLKSLQQLMGHSNIKTTLEYVNADMEGLRKLQDLL